MSDNTGTKAIQEIIEAMERLGLEVLDIHYETTHEACGKPDTSITGCIHVKVSVLRISEL
jgi:hypothetical protein